MEGEWAVRALFAVGGVIAGAIAGVHQNRAEIKRLSGRVAELVDRVAHLEGMMRYFMEGARKPPGLP